MAAPKIESWDLSSLKSKLRSDEALRHLRVVKRGLVCTLVSGPEDDPWKHVRLRRDTVHLWRLEMAVRGGRKWERTPFRDTLDELLLLPYDPIPMDHRAGDGEPGHDFGSAELDSQTQHERRSEPWA